MPTPRSTLQRLTRSLSLVLCGCLTVGCLLLSDKPDYYQCRSDGDCIAGQEVCEFDGYSVGKCMPIGYCRFDQDCSGTGAQRCFDERCTTVECTPNDSAACDQYRCGTGDRCLTVCASDADCQALESAPYYCSAGACVRDQCYTLCPGGYTCENHVCHTSCTYPSDCAGGYTCVGSTCQDL